MGIGMGAKLCAQPRTIYLYIPRPNGASDQPQRTIYLYIMRRNSPNGPTAHQTSSNLCLLFCCLNVLQNCSHSTGWVTAQIAHHTNQSNSVSDHVKQTIGTSEHGHDVSEERKVRPPTATTPPTTQRRIRPAHPGPTTRLPTRFPRFATPGGRLIFLGPSMTR